MIQAQGFESWSSSSFGDCYNYVVKTSLAARRENFLLVQFHLLW